MLFYSFSVIISADLEFSAALLMVVNKSIESNDPQTKHDLYFNTLAVLKECVTSHDSFLGPEELKNGWLETVEFAYFYYM